MDKVLTQINNNCLGYESINVINILHIDIVEKQVV